VTEGEYAEWLAQGDAEDPTRCDVLYNWASEGDPDFYDLEMMEWCSMPWGHQYPSAGADRNIYHSVLNDKGQVCLQWPDPTEIALGR
jgi:hypothetical protein